MPEYKIIRIYAITAKSVSDATKKLLDAVEAKQDETYHVSDSVRESDESASSSKPVAWADSVKKQLLGK